MNILEYLNKSFDNFITAVAALNQSEATIYSAILGGIFTLLTAFAGIMFAFRQLQKQFEYKVIHEGWKDFQEKLYLFSSQLVKHTATVQGLIFTLRQQSNPLVNGGNQEKYLEDKSNELSESYSLLMKTYVNFFKSYETHEILFTELTKLKNGFYEAWKKVNIFEHHDFRDFIFPISRDLQESNSLQDKEKRINEMVHELTTINTLLDDFRREMQNATLGVILNKSLEKRKPTIPVTMLTKNGLIHYHPYFHLWVQSIISKLIKDKKTV